MSRQNHYKWLIVTEGKSDIAIYKEYLKDRISFDVISTGGKNSVLNMNAWGSDNIQTLITDVGRTGFKGLVLIIDSDDSSVSPFKEYRRFDNNLPYIGDKPTPVIDPTNSFWNLDYISGKEEILPIRGINVPTSADGCLETDLLSAYGFPTESQPERGAFIDIIEKATGAWKIPNKNDGNPWWTDNKNAKMDKFIYVALREGFSRVCDKRPVLPPNEPDVIKNMRAAMTVVNSTMSVAR